jgi:hypothetical protein
MIVLRRALKTARPEPTPANSLDRGSIKKWKGDSATAVVKATEVMIAKP